MSVVLQRLTRPVTLRRVAGSGSVDEYGTPTGTETSTPIIAHVRPLSSKELPSNVAGARWKLYVAPSVVLDVDDRVEFDGEIFEVVTKPAERYNPRSRLVEAIECEIEASS